MEEVKEDTTSRNDQLCVVYSFLLPYRVPVTLDHGRYARCSVAVKPTCDGVVSGRLFTVCTKVQGIALAHGLSEEYLKEDSKIINHSPT